jgi:HPt (histidine-containing phosphotransfer) domain-containing protein
MMDIARRFVSDAQVVLFEIERAIRSEDDDALRRSAAALRSQALFLGLRPLAHHCGLIELHPATGHRETELAIIRGEIDQLQKALQREDARTVG